MPDRKVIRSEILVDAVQRAVWDYITDGAQLIELCRATLGIRVMLEDADANPYRPEVQQYVFKARLTPYDVLLTSQGCSYALRFVETNGMCRIIAAASFDDNAFVRPNEEQLTQLLTNIKKEAEMAAAISRYAAQAEQPTAKKEKTDAAERKKDALPFDLMEQDIEIAALRKKTQSQNKSGRKSGIVILIAILLVGALVASYFLVPQVRRLFEPAVPPQVGYSAKVTLQNALLIAPGDSKASVNQLFETDGIEGPERSSAIYCGGELRDDSAPAIQVCVRFTGTIVLNVTYLDLNAATTVNGSYNDAFNARADMPVTEIAGGVGANVSMLRRYKSADDVVTEVHFGYTDPFANFDPAWRGELVFALNPAQAVAEKKMWSGYDGSDPLMVGSLEGHPVHNQYTSYTDFLNDKYQYDQALYMLNRYSRGDAAQVFGELELYSDLSGVILYYNNSAETLPDSDDPLYRMSFGFDSKGYFLMSSYANMRLFDREGALVDSDYAGITRGMAYNEIRQIMRILPTAVFVDKNYFTLCYGKRLDSDVFELQFEFMVRFDIENNYAQFVWDNTDSVGS